MTVSNCLVCGKEYEKKTGGKYCSDECRRCGRLESLKKYSDKTKKKIVLDDAEEWREIKDFENLYFINRNGVIRGKNGDLKPSISKAGYYYVSLCKESKHCTKNIHRLLAETFIDNHDNKPMIDHIDRNRLNNNLENLRWVTCSENNSNSDRVEFKKGCISISRTRINDKIYVYYRFFYYEDNKKKSKIFKTREDAENYQRNFNQ